MSYDSRNPQPIWATRKAVSRWRWAGALVGGGAITLVTVFVTILADFLLSLATSQGSLRLRDVAATGGDTGARTSDEAELNTMEKNNSMNPGDSSVAVENLGQIIQSRPMACLGSSPFQNWAEDLALLLNRLGHRGQVRHLSRPIVMHRVMVGPFTGGTRDYKLVEVLEHNGIGYWLLRGGEGAFAVVGSYFYRTNADNFQASLESIGIPSRVIAENVPVKVWQVCVEPDEK